MSVIDFLLISQPQKMNGENKENMVKLYMHVSPSSYSIWGLIITNIAIVGDYTATETDASVY